MSEKPSGKPQTLSRRDFILGAIGAAATGVTAGVAINGEIEKRKQDAIASNINTFRSDSLEDSRIKQQAAQKASQPTPTLPTATPTPALENPKQPEKPITRIGYFREGFSPDELVEFCKMIKEQEDILDAPGNPNNIGISTEKIKNYLGRFGPIVDKIFPLASQAAGLDMFPDPELRDLFHSLILAESIGDPKAVSNMRAVGLTQITPVGAMDSLLIVGRKWLKEPKIYGPLWDLVKKSNPVTENIINPKDFNPEKITEKGFKQQSLFDPTINIALGAVQFLALMDRFNDNLGLAISAYDAGSKVKSAENKYWELEGNPPFMPTNRPNFIEVFKKRKELGLEEETNENWVYLPRIFAIYRKIKGPQAFPLAA